MSMVAGGPRTWSREEIDPSYGGPLATASLAGEHALTRVPSDRGFKRLAVPRRERVYELVVLEKVELRHGVDVEAPREVRPLLVLVIEHVVPRKDYGRRGALVRVRCVAKPRHCAGDVFARAARGLVEVDDEEGAADVLRGVMKMCAMGLAVRTL